jgi:acyl-coenzyme A thioesterase PaaI-like protein
MADTASGHFIATLDVAIEDTSHPTERVVRLLIGREGLIDVGPLALLADIVGGGCTAAQVGPRSMSTTEMSIHGLAALRGPGMLVAKASLVGLSRNRSTASVRLWFEERPQEVAAASVVFKLWPNPMPKPSNGGEWTTGSAAVPLKTTLAEFIGVAVDADGLRAEVALRADMHNHVESLQGGLTAALLEAAARTCVDPAASITTMAITYVAQARVGPVRATAQRVGALGVIEVEAVDTGNENRVVASALVSTSSP